MLTKEELSVRLSKLNEEREQLEAMLNQIREMLSQDGVQQVSFDLVKSVMSKFSEIISNASTKEQRKQLLFLLISVITIGETRKVNTIKIQLNRKIFDYLGIKGEEALLLNSNSSSLFLLFIYVYK